MQVVRSGPDIQEDQRPEVYDRQAIGIDRAARLFGHEIIHHPQKACCQEKPDRIVTIPPLGQGILNPGKGGIAFRSHERDWYRQVVHNMQHRHGDNERQIEPVGDIDMGFTPGHDCPQENHQIRDPDNCQQQIDIPFRFGIFARLGNPDDIAGRRQDDKKLITPEHEPGEVAPKQLLPRRALDHPETGADQGIPTKGKNHCRRVQGAQPPKIQIGFNIQVRPSQLGGDHNTNQKTNNAPEQCRNDTIADGPIDIGRR